LLNQSIQKIEYVGYVCLSFGRMGGGRRLYANKLHSTLHGVYKIVHCVLMLSGA